MACFIQQIHSLLAVPEVGYALRILIALLCGAAIGLERSLRAKEAGIRTHAILAAATALLAVLSKYGFADLQVGTDVGGADGGMIIHQIINGIGFMGAGLIFKGGRKAVSGMTTAAGIWGTASVGIACGCGMVALGIFSALFFIGLQILLHALNIGGTACIIQELRLTLKNSKNSRILLSKLKRQYGIEVLNVRCDRTEDAQYIRLVLLVQMRRSIPFRDALRFIDEHPDIKEFSA